MPALSTLAGSTILVTGGTGHVGAGVIHDLLQRGAIVRATVRNETSGRDLLKQFPTSGSKLSMMVVPSIAAEGAYNHAVHGVDGIVHVASPVVFSDVDPKDLILPAVQGAVGIVKSAKRFGSRVKRVVITGSVSAMGPTGLDDVSGLSPIILDDTNYYDEVVERVTRLGAKAPPADKYSASKVLSERAVWEWMDRNKPGFDVTVVLPCPVLGPWYNHIASKEKIRSSLAFFIDAMKGSGKPEAEVRARELYFIDIRDVAAIHSMSLTEETAGGERIIAANDFYSWQEMYDILNAAQPPFPSGSIPRGVPYLANEVLQPGRVKYDTSKLFRIFPDIKLHSLQDMTIDLARQLEKRGWLA